MREEINGDAIAAGVNGMILISSKVADRHSFPAHIRWADKVRHCQTVREHCRHVATYAAGNLSSIGLSNTGYLAGLLHDAGKCTETFADYIEKAAKGEPVARGSVNHTFMGVIYLLEKFHMKETPDISTITSEILAYAVGSHHGEFDCIDTEKENGFDHRLHKDKESIHYSEALQNYLNLCTTEEEIDRLFRDAVTEIGEKMQHLKETCISKTTTMAFATGMLARLVLSAVIDGDRRDTAEFMLDRQISSVQTDIDLWRETLSRVEGKISEFQSNTPINEARAFFSKTCHTEGEHRSSGIYRLTLPTGAGKTLSSLRFALANAMNLNKKRIIFVIPLLSILEQNSSVIRKYVGNDRIITEHHSNFVKDFNSEEELDEYEFFTETWNSPIIITTLVQLLNTLFSGKTSSIRRMSALADSVIIIDEVQSLPKKTLFMFNVAMDFLAYACGATIVLSSATQPVLDTVKTPIHFSANKDIIPFDPVRNAIFKRTKILNCTTPYGMNIDDLSEFCREKFEGVCSLLIICNTKSSAVKLYDRVRQTHRGDKVFHLSASMCMRHRIDTLQSIQECLANKEKVICISTQLVEAGVDFSFQRVIRVLAGLDNVAQAAGRCNRSGDFGYLCDVFIVNMKASEENLNMLKEIYAAQRSTEALLRVFNKDSTSFGDDIVSDKSVQMYYESLFKDPEIEAQFEYRTTDTNGDERRLYRLLSSNSELIDSQRPIQYYLNQSFKTAGMLFEVFDENTTDILVPYNETAKNIISDLMSERAKWNQGIIADLIELAKPYLIRIFEYQKRQLSDAGMLYSDPSNHFMILNELCYSSESGLRNGDVFL